MSIKVIIQFQCAMGKGKLFWFSAFGFSIGKTKCAFYAVGFS